MMSGWQQPPSFGGCIHFDLLGAQLMIGKHEVGHVWVCRCGKRYVVQMSNGRKVLVAE